MKPRLLLLCILLLLMPPSVLADAMRRHNVVVTRLDCQGFDVYSLGGGQHRINASAEFGDPELVLVFVWWSPLSGAGEHHLFDWPFEWLACWESPDSSHCPGLHKPLPPPATITWQFWIHDKKGKDKGKTAATLRLPCLHRTYLPLIEER